MTVASVSFIIFLVAVAITAIISATLYYHWIRYGVGIVGSLTVMIVFGVGTVGLLMMILGVVVQM